MKICAICFLIFSLTGFCCADPLFYVNGKGVEKGENVILSENDLIEDTMGFKINAPENIQTVEISYDDGNSFETMDKLGEDYIYSYYPSESQIMPIKFKFYDQDAKEQVLDTEATIQYELPE